MQIEAVTSITIVIASKIYFSISLTLLNHLAYSTEIKNG